MENIRLHIILVLTNSLILFNILTYALITKSRVYLIFGNTKNIAIIILKSCHYISFILKLPNFFTDYIKF